MYSPTLSHCSRCLYKCSDFKEKQPNRALPLLATTRTQDFSDRLGFLISKNRMKNLIIILLFSACTRVSTKPEPEPEPCQLACERLQSLQCIEATPEPGRDGIPNTADDISCIEWMCAADYLDYQALSEATECPARGS